MATGLELECAVDLVTLNAHHDFLVASQFALGLTDDLGLPALAVTVAHIHAQQVAGKQGRLVAARAGANFNKGVARVVGVFGQQHALQLALQLRQLCVRGIDFFLGHRQHVRIVGGACQHILPCSQIRFALLVAVPAAGDGGHFRMLSGKCQELRHVFHDVFTRQQEFELSQAHAIALHLGTEIRFHGMP